MASLGLRIMDGSASAAEQRKANEMNQPVIEGEVLADVWLALPVHTAEPQWESLDARKTTSNPPSGWGAGRDPHHTRTAHRFPAVRGEYPARDVPGSIADLHARRGAGHGDRHSSGPGLRRAGVGHVLRGAGDHGRDDQ